jgi:threonine synthase
MTDIGAIVLSVMNDGVVNGFAREAGKEAYTALKERIKGLLPTKDIEGAALRELINQQPEQTRSELLTLAREIKENLKRPTITMKDIVAQGNGGAGVFIKGVTPHR